MGQRAYLNDSPNQRGSNLTILMAVSPLLGCVHYQLTYGKVNQQTFLQFIYNMFVGLLSHPKDCARTCRFTVIMDNVSFHKTDAVINFFNTYKHPVNNTQHRHVTLPVYSPMLNPVENCWNIVKNYVRYNQVQPDNRLTLEQLVHESISQIDSRYVFNAYQGTKKYYRDILERNDIFS